MKKVIFLLSLVMFFFKTSVTANYEKKIYDFSIEGITGEIIDFKDYNIYNKYITQIFWIKVSFEGIKESDTLYELEGVFKSLIEKDGRLIFISSEGTIELN